MLHAVIMAGGSGTRFWPASRRGRPKQLLRLTGEESLLQSTVSRLEPLLPPECVWVVTSEELVDDVRRQLPEVPPAQVVGEPEGRDTAACAGLAAVAVSAADPDAVCLLLPADHVIPEASGLCAALDAGVEHVRARGGLLTFGIRPTRPETGYGYLRLGEEETTIGRFAVHRLDRFVEKPDPATAVGYVAGGDHLWNSGMFAFRPADLRGEIERQLPRLHDGLTTIADGWDGADRDRVLHEKYPSLPRISLDHGVMEGARTAWTIPVDFRWSDVGSWSALNEIVESDPDGNVCRGRVLALDCRASTLVADREVTLTAVGVEGLIVVATPDAVLVTPRGEAQRVKQVVERLRELGWDDVL